MSRLRCPYCNSEKGYFTLNDVKEVPVHFSFDGKLIRKDVDAGKVVETVRKKAYCAECGQMISTERELKDRIRRYTAKNPIAIYRKKAGLTQEELSQKIGCSRESVAGWECFGTRPRKQYVEQMAELFNSKKFLIELEEYYGK